MVGLAPETLTTEKFFGVDRWRRGRSVDHVWGGKLGIALWLACRAASKCFCAVTASKRRARSSKPFDRRRTVRAGMAGWGKEPSLEREHTDTKQGPWW